MKAQQQNTGENSILLIKRADQLLAEATTVQKAKELKNLALTAKDWAERKSMGHAVVDHARRYAILAEDRLGQLLKATERAKGGRPYQANSTPNQREGVTPTLSDLGVSYKEATNAQRFYDLDTDIKQDVIEGRTTRINAFRQQRMRHVPEATEMSKGTYRVIYADPPWRYNDKLAVSKDGGREGYGPAQAHYPEMTLQQVCDLPVKEIVAPNAVLFLWVPVPLLEQSFAVIHAWGFQYKTCYIWDKVKHNMGHYSSVRHEQLMLATRGSCTPDTTELLDSVVSIRRERHSEKPDWFRRMIDTLYPNGSRIELFARGKEHSGWQRWGNECHTK